MPTIIVAKRKILDPCRIITDTMLKAVLQNIPLDVIPRTNFHLYRPLLPHNNFIIEIGKTPIRSGAIQLAHYRLISMRITSSSLPHYLSRHSHLKLRDYHAFFKLLLSISHPCVPFKVLPAFIKSSKSQEEDNIDVLNKKGGSNSK